MHFEYRSCICFEAMTGVGPMEIADYGVIGNCRTAALVSKEGSIDWCCFPRFDSPSQFGRILDPAGGHFSVRPAAPFRSSQAYLDDTNVLTTRFVADGGGTVVLTDLMPVDGRRPAGRELWADTEILRVLEAERGETELEMELRSDVELREAGALGIRGMKGRMHFMLQASPARVRLRRVETAHGAAVAAAFRLRAGERAIFSLSFSEEAPAVIPSLETAPERLERTARYWRAWAGRCSHGGPWGPLVRRSALALKLLNFAPSGAFVAAPTASLPEWIGGSRNWDYRYCWLRDASFTTRALVRLGYLDEARAFLNWLLHSTRLTWPRLQVLYTVFGESRIGESVAPGLAGFLGSKPVRFGNEASTQVQLDVYGEVIDSFFSLVDFLGPIDRETKKMVTGFGSAVAELWRKPDQGIWELRSRPRHHTHSKVMCWVAMDRLGKLAARFGWRLPYDAAKIASDIRREIESQGFDARLGAYTGAFGETRLDASVLVMPLVGYCDASAPRYLSTLRAITRELGRGGLLYRYRPGSDGIAGPEGTFTICSFWLAEALARAGLADEARERFLSVVRAAPPTGLLSEEIDPDRRRFLGNHPQGFSHVGLINAAVELDGRGRAAA